MAFVQNMALSTLGPTIARRITWSWVGYGAAVYVGLRVARHYGWFGEFPDRALHVIENGARTFVGIAPKKTESAAAGARF
ncbi:MAG TPA: hypothetical protein VM432_10190 [Bdellovibrionales bacterium]|nr:hypothetical protein [Bdellovibrionales bacterium]